MEVTTPLRDFPGVGDAVPKAWSGWASARQGT